MNFKAAICLVFALTTHVVCAAIVDDKLMSSEKELKEQPIVIHTQVPSYEQPTLAEYMKCHENLDSCMNICESSRNRTACEAECPVCPILINQDVVVQGINDTYIRIPITTPLNTTNIIRLTNEIRNIIDNKMGNITARNENTVHVHQTNTTIGGRFGLGYNQRGPCCIVVRSSKNCNKQKFSSSQQCHHKRHRVCSERCKSRVMIAKRVKRCNANGGDCSTGVVYEAAHRCRSVQHWPYVSCGNKRMQRNCWHCLQMPYMQILQYGVSPSCVPCYRRYSNEYAYNSYDDIVDYEQYYPAAPPRRPYAYDDANDYDDWINTPLSQNAGWQVEKTKCRRFDGSIIENCIDETQTAMPEHSGDAADSFDSNDYDLFDRNDLAEEGFNDIDSSRYRRAAFRRSKYSLRYQGN